MPRINGQLVFELRSRYKLAAYTHTMKFDHRAEGSNKCRAGHRQVRYRLNEMREIAVLVGDYQGVEDRAAKDAREAQAAQPDCLDVEKCAKDGKPDSRTPAPANDSAGRAARGKSEEKTRAHAERVHHDQSAVARRVLRAQGDRSPGAGDERAGQVQPLGLPGQYTVKVATFTGRVVIDQKQIQEIEKKNKPFDSQLADAADKRID